MGPSVSKGIILKGNETSFIEYLVPPSLNLMYVKPVSTIWKTTNIYRNIYRLKNTFGTVNYSVLLDKLQQYRIRGQAYKWFKNYFTNRKQYVQLGEYSK